MGSRPLSDGGFRLLCWFSYLVVDADHVVVLGRPEGNQRDCSFSLHSSFDRKERKSWKQEQDITAAPSQAVPGIACYRKLALMLVPASTEP